MEVSPEKKEIYRKQVIQRAGSNIRKLVKENNLKFHWSLTYAENMKDKEKAKYDFMKFMLRLNYITRKKVHYVAVMEKQKRGAWHFHLAINEFIDFDVMSNTWGNGFVYVGYYSGNVDMVSSYLGKYLKKEMENQYDSTGDKLYLCSKGLKRPVKGNAFISSEKLQEIQNKADVSKNYDGLSWNKYVEKST